MQLLKKKYTYILVILIGLLYFFWKTRYVIFGAYEEYELFYTVQKGDVFLWLDIVSRQSGRIGFYVLSWFWAGPMFIDNPMVYRIFLMLLVAVGVIVFFRLVYKHIDKQLAFFAAAVVVFGFQISDQHNLLIAYSFLHFGFISVVLSTHLILDYCKGWKNYKAVAVSAALNFFACFLQENFILFYVLVFVIMFMYGEQRLWFKRVGKTLWELRFHVAGGFVFLVVYFMFNRYCGGGSYGGVSLCLSKPLESLKVLVLFMSGMLPGRTFLELVQTEGVNGLLRLVGKMDVVFIIFAVVCVSVFAYRSNKLKKAGKAITLLIMAALFSCVLHAVSSQYIGWVSEYDTYAYVPSYYCCFFLTTAICILLNQVIGSLKGRVKAVGVGILAVVMAGVMLMTVSVNNYYTAVFQEQYFHYEDYRNYFRECDFENLEADAQILLEDSYAVNPDLIKQSMTVYYYDAFYFNIVTNIKEIDATKTYYILKYGEDGTVSMEGVK